MKKPLSRTLVRERGIKQLYARFSAGGRNFTLDSSACCLKNSTIIIPQTCGVVKCFLKFLIKFFCCGQAAEKPIKASKNQTPYFRVFRRMPGPMVEATVALLK